MSYRRRLMMASKEKYEYITDGLVLHLDGKWNGGVGKHLDATDTWVDLSPAGNNATTLNGTNVSFGRDYAEFTSADAFISLVDLPAAHDLTVEVWFRSGFAANYKGVGCWGYKDTKQRFSFMCWKLANSQSNSGALQYVRGGSLSTAVGFRSHGAFTYNKADTMFRLYDGDGQQFATYNTDLTNTNDTTPAICINVKSDTNEIGPGGTLYMVRVYNRTLSAEEIAYNTALDNKRLGK